MSGRSALALRGVVKSFGTLRALDGIDLDVTRGQIHALIGLNGAGKTTLMRLALGMQLADAGEIEVLGECLVRGECAAWPRVGHLVETPALCGELSARDNVTVVARLRGLGRTAATTASASALGAMSLEAWADRPARTLSLGNRQRVGLAGALLGEPELLLLDEPANALDPSGVVLVRTMLSDAAARGCGVLVSSHHLDEVARIADRISVMHRGRLVGSLLSDQADLEHAFFELVLAADEASDGDLEATA